MTENQTDSPLIDPSVVSGESSSPVAVATDIPTRKTTPDKGGFFWGTGRRKSSVARVRIRPGEGKILINNRELDEYFSQPRDRTDAVAPLKATETDKGLDVFVNVNGGGTSGQAGAVMLGVARALKHYDMSLMQALRDGNFLTRDPRMVERKKPGKPGARKSFQFSKR